MSYVAIFTFNIVCSFCCAWPNLNFQQVYKNYLNVSFRPSSRYGRCFMSLGMNIRKLLKKFLSFALGYQMKIFNSKCFQASSACLHSPGRSIKKPWHAIKLTGRQFVNKVLAICYWTAVYICILVEMLSNENPMANKRFL